jgi:hypothetical protein
LDISVVHEQLSSPQTHFTLGKTHPCATTQTRL